MGYLILAINPGSTNTKIGLFENNKNLYKETIEHDGLDKYPDIMTQKEMRKDVIVKSLLDHGFKLNQLSVVVGRGGMLPPVQTGGYIVNEALIELLQNGPVTPHASNLGGILANDIAKMAGEIPSYIYDAVSANEFPPLAQVTGFPEVKRTSFCHVLNSRSVAHRYAEEQGKSYDEMDLIVAHLGGGISISVHNKGRIVDSLADDNGPFSPERSGGLPLLDFVELCFASKDKNTIKRRVRGNGGLKAHLGTSNCRDIEDMMKAGNEEAKLLLDAEAYQIAKGIGLLAPVLKGKFDAIILTGGVAKSNYIVDQVKDYVDFIAPVVVIPGEFELEALAEGALRLLKGEEKAHEYVL